MSASNSPLTLALVAALASSLTMHFVGYQNNKYSHSHGRDLRRRKNKSRAGFVGDFFADDLCQDFCTVFFRDCSNYNPYTNPDAWKWQENSDYSRRLSADNEIKHFQKPRALLSNVFSGNYRAKISKEPDQGRKDKLLDNDVARAECLQTCMNWPRPMEPANYTGTAPGQDSGGGGDTFWCRRWHVRQATDLNNAAFHCPHATDSSLGICRDALVDEHSPYEWLKQEASTLRRHPFCDVAGAGFVVDCTMGGITDDNFHDVLASLPGNMEILFLNGNSITKINGPLAQHLIEPTNLKALYMNDNGLKMVSADAFKGLDNLEVWNADVNQVATLDKDFLQYTPKLKQFSMHDNPDLFTPSIPAGFFQHTPKLEIMFTYGTGVETFLPGTFDGLTSLIILSFVGNMKITEKSFPDPPKLFKDLTSLLFFDFFGNDIKSIPENFFGPWASKVIRLAFWNCPITSIHKNAGLQHLKGIEQAYFHESRNITTGEPSPGLEGGSFDYGPVLQELTKINSKVTMTYGATPAPTPSQRNG